MLRLELLAAAILLLAVVACFVFLDTPAVFYYWPVLTLDTKAVPTQATFAVPPGFLNLKVVPAYDDSTPQWPTTVSWRIADARNKVVWAGETNLETSKDLRWRRPLEMRELFSEESRRWRSGDRLRPGAAYRLEVLSAAGVAADVFVVEMYYVAPVRLRDRLTCFGRCVRRRNPATLPAG